MKSNLNRRIMRFMSPNEWEHFCLLLKETAQKIPEITGILGVGSLMWAEEIPEEFFALKRHSTLGIFYGKILNTKRYRHEISTSTDCDIWICIQDTDASRCAQKQIENNAKLLLSKIISGDLQWGTSNWSDKEYEMFNIYYKNISLYPKSLQTSNEPWMIHSFKQEFEKKICLEMPDFVDKINNYFSAHIPGGFFEIRAYPESIFNLRPEDNFMESGIKNRAPFPFIADEQWINPEYNSIVLYKNGANIYPFDINGRILGESIEQFINTSEKNTAFYSYGAFIIKPDAFEKKQFTFICRKLMRFIEYINAEIIYCELLQNLQVNDIYKIYPTLCEQDILDLKDYFIGKNIMIIILKSNLPQPELFRLINELKGSRIGDRNSERLQEGRILDGNIRDLLPVPGEESLYMKLISKILSRKIDTQIRFSSEEYKYYCQNLVHSPENEIELQGILNLIGLIPESR